jgi:ribonuclease HI
MLLVSPTGQLHKYAIQLAFPLERCTSSTVECEGLLASLRIASGMGISHLSVWGDSKLAAGHAKGVEIIPLMKAYTGEVQKLECHFHSLKLEHVPHRQDVAVKELSQIAAKELPVPVGVMVERLFQPSAVPEDEELGSPTAP